MKIAYLTIDDAPSEDFKQKVDFLLAKKISAIFFCEGRYLEGKFDDVIYAIKKGFVIGNHSYSHPHASNLSDKEVFEEIEKTDKIIDEIYKKAGIKRPIKVFRFPYGDKGWGAEDSDKGGPKDKKLFAHSKAIQNFLKKLGYKQPRFKGINYKWYKKAKVADDRDVYWTYDVMEWSIRKWMLKGECQFGIKTIEDVWKRMDEDVPEGCRGINFQGSNEIIIIHDNKETTKYFEEIIERLLSKGIKFEIPKF